MHETSLVRFQGHDRRDPPYGEEREVLAWPSSSSSSSPSPTPSSLSQKFAIPPRLEVWVGPTNNDDSNDYGDGGHEYQLECRQESSESEGYASFNGMESFHKTRNELLRKRTPSTGLQLYESDRSSSATVDQGQRLRQKAEMLDPLACLDMMDVILPSGMMQLDNLLFYSPPSSSNGADTVVVRVVATTVEAKPEVEATCTIAQIEESRCASFFVGAVERYDSRYSREQRLEVGSLVTSMQRCHTRARFVNVKAQNLVLLPEMFDVGEAVTVVSTYLPAFGALHHGAKNRNDRYSTNCFKGKRIFVVGGSWAEARATSKLALLAGAKRIYVLLSGTFVLVMDDDQAEKVLASGATPDDWLPRLRNRIDVLIDSQFPNCFDLLQSTVKKGGRYVCRSPTTPPDAFNQSFWSWCCGDLEDVCQQTALCVAADNSSMYDFDSVDPALAEQDLTHLYRLLARRQLIPKIERYITLDQLEDAQKLIHSQVALGSVICEPWRS